MQPHTIRRRTKDALNRGSAMVWQMRSFQQFLPEAQGPARQEAQAWRPAIVDVDVDPATQLPVGGLPFGRSRGKTAASGERRRKDPGEAGSRTGKWARGPLYEGPVGACKLSSVSQSRRGYCMAGDTQWSCVQQNRPRPGKTPQSRGINPWDVASSTLQGMRTNWSGCCSRRPWRST